MNNEKEREREREREREGWVGEGGEGVYRKGERVDNE